MMEKRSIYDKEPRATINPYRNAFNLFMARLLWDLHPYSWISRKRILLWKDRFLNEMAVILCNGPSLARINFDELLKQNIFTFGLNKINLIFSKTSFRPSVIVAVNPFVIEQNAIFYNATDIPLFIDSRYRKIIKFSAATHFIHVTQVPGPPGRFARDCSYSVSQGHTVTYVALQLAFHMGFRKVALVGCDHSFNTKGPANNTVLADSQDLNHFDPNYFPIGSKWQLPDLIGSELNYEFAQKTFKSHGGKIVNCTDGGELEVFERLTLNQFLA